MSFEIKKVYTENPYVDEMVYYTKLLAAGTTLKMQDEADRNETVESLRNSELFISCMEGTVIFELLPFVTREALNSVGIVDEISVNECIKNKYNIPLDRRDKILKYMSSYFINNYEEINPYYRSLHGLPPKGREDYVEDWIPPIDIAIDLSKPVHEMSNAEIAILESYGVIYDMIQEDPVGRQYMYHLGSKKIDYYTARRANRFDPLYIPKIDSESIFKMYKDKLDANKFYVLRTVYSEAFKYNSDYYDNFIAVLIIVITMIDIISRVQEFVVRKEIFDIRSVQYIFESNGVPFFEEIPLRYQISMVKNLHTLLKYKSTAKCMVNICSLFGFDNIQIFKYYLLRDRTVDLSTGEYVYELDDEGKEILEKEYELKFLKLPLEDDIDDYIRNPSSYLDYDEITMSDPTWDGGLDHEEIMKAVLEEEFNFVKTKYISIDSITDIAKASAQQSYFFNFLYDNVYIEELVRVKIPFIEAGKEFRVVDVFTLLTALTYIYKGVKDTIMDTQSKVLYVNGFNFKANLAVLAEEIGPIRIPDTPDGYIVDPGGTKHAKQQLERFTDEVDDYVEVNRVQKDDGSFEDEVNIKASIPSFKELMNIFINCMDIRDELIKGMNNADNKKVYDVYKKLYDSLMTVQLTLDFYKNPETGDFYRDEDGDATYSAFLAHRDPSLYSVIIAIQSYMDDASRNQYISNVIDSIIYALEEYIDTKEFASIFSNLPILSIDAVKNYIATIINFYKSYKVDFLGINTIYIFDDKYDGAIKLIDEMLMNRYFCKTEFVTLFEDFKSFASMKYKDRVSLIDRMYMDISTWVYKTYKDDCTHIMDKMGDMLIKFVSHTLLYLEDEINGINLRPIFYDTIYMMESCSISTNLSPKDKVDISDRLWIYNEGEASIYSDYMDKLSKEYAGNIVIADTRGNSDPGGKLSSVVTGEDEGIILTEKAVSDYVKKITLSKNSIVTYDEIMAHEKSGTSDSLVPSEKAILEALSVKYYKSNQ